MKQEWISQIAILTCFIVILLVDSVSVTGCIALSLLLCALIIVVYKFGTTEEKENGTD